MWMTVLKLTYSMQQQMFNLQKSFNYVVIPENMVYERVVIALKAVEINWSHVTNVRAII